MAHSQPFNLDDLDPLIHYCHAIFNKLGYQYADVQDAIQEVCVDVIQKFPDLAEFLRRFKKRDYSDDERFWLLGIIGNAKARLRRRCNNWRERFPTDKAAEIDFAVSRELPPDVQLIMNEWFELAVAKMNQQFGQRSDEARIAQCLRAGVEAKKMWREFEVPEKRWVAAYFVVIEFLIQDMTSIWNEIQSRKKVPPR